MPHLRTPAITLAATALAVALATPAGAATVRVTVTVRNLAPANSISFAPLRVGFNKGTFDAFDEGGTPTAPIISIAEGGSGSDWFPAFAAADPTATAGHRFRRPRPARHQLQRQLPRRHPGQPVLHLRRHGRAQQRFLHR